MGTTEKQESRNAFFQSSLPGGGLMNRFISAGLFLMFLMVGCSGESRDSVSATAADLSGWKVVGGGSIEALDNDEGYRLREGTDSNGVTLVSPDSYGPNVVLTFRVKPEQREGVCVVFLAASDSTGQLEIPPDNDGSIGFWSEGSVRNYMIAFHTAYHQPNLFIRKNPGLVDIAQTPDVAVNEEWYDMEIGKQGPRVWVSVNGTMALEGIDPDGTGLPGGRIGIRLRGPGDGSYSCLVRDVSIRTE